MHSSTIPRRIALLAAAVALTLPLFGGVALADDDDVADAAVARISLITGNVAVQRGDTDAPSAAVINAPLLAGDFLTTGDGSRAEVEITGGTLVRLGDNVQMRFTHLDNDSRAIQLAAGTIDLRLFRGTDGSSDIDTPSITVRPRASGSYRVTVTGDGQTLVTVRSGDAAIVTPQGEQPLDPGTTLVAQGPASNPAITTQDAIVADAFDQFNDERDARFAPPPSGQSANVDENIAGVQDLNAYGSWVSDPTYGQVWAPANVAPDWAPYVNGRWVWEDGFGWTWVAAEPWGWAPYHYGSWYRSPSYGWVWYPPRPAVTVAVWRPAMVAFFSFGGGGGGGFAVGGGGGFGLSVGWVALAPFEPYHPWWGPHWGSNTNITINNTYINNTTIVHSYRNAQYGIASVSSERFTQGNFRHPMMVQAADLHDVQAVHGALPIVPTAANLRYSGRPVAPELAVHPAFAQQRFAGVEAPVHRVPFEQQRTAYATVTHLPLSGAVHGDVPGRAPGTAPGGAYQPGGASHPAGSDAWSRFGENRGTAVHTGAAAAPAAAPGSGFDRARGTGNAPDPAFDHQRGTGNYAPGTGNGGYTRPDGAARTAAPVRTTPGSGYVRPDRTSDSGTRAVRSYDAAPRPPRAAVVPHAPHVDHPAPKAKPDHHHDGG